MEADLSSSARLLLASVEHGSVQGSLVSDTWYRARAIDRFCGTRFRAHTAEGFPEVSLGTAQRIASGGKKTGKAPNGSVLVSAEHFDALARLYGRKVLMFFCRSPSRSSASFLAFAASFCGASSCSSLTDSAMETAA